MNRKAISKEFSRRDFLRVAGTGLVGAAFVGATGCGGGQGGGGTGGGGGEFTLVTGHQLAADTPFDKGLKKFADLVEEKTDGQVTVQVNPAAQIGDEAEMFQGMRDGTVDAAVVAPGSIGEFVPEINIFSVPFLVTSREQRDKVINGEPAERLEQLVQDQTSVRTMGYFGGGIRNMFFTEPASSLEDIQGRLFRVKASQLLQDSYSALGLKTEVVAGDELYNALRQGVVDGAENESVFVLSEAYYEAAPHLLLTKHEVTIRPFYISSQTLDRLPEDLSEAVLEAGSEASEWERELEGREDDQALETLQEEHGLEVTEVDTDPMVAAIEPVWQEYAKEWGMEDTLQQIRDAKTE